MLFNPTNTWQKMCLDKLSHYIPWAEAYYHDGKGGVQTIFQRPAVRGNPEDLNAIEGKNPYPYPDFDIPYGGKFGYWIRDTALADRNPQKDIFGYEQNAGGPR